MKNKEFIIIGSIVVIIAVVVTIANAMKPTPINWDPTYAAHDKIPFGLYVLDNEAPNLFGPDSIHKFGETAYEFLDKKYDFESSEYKVKGTFLKISEGNSIDRESAKELLHFADYGNTVVLSMKSFPPALLDTLGIKIGYQQIMIDSVAITLQGRPTDKFWIKEGMGTSYFDSIPQNDSVKVIGYQDIKGESKPNFIEARFGQGRFLLHTQPAAFSNFYLLKTDYFQYAEKVLSRIPNGTIYWQDESANTYEFQKSGSSLRYIMSQPGLKWAWRLGLWGLLLFIIFNARRRQRIVPEIAPVRNTTVDFAKTIGNLYYQEGDHHTIIEKKIIYFLEHIRSEYLLDTSSLDDAFIDKLHQKTGKPIADIEAAIQLIKKFRHNFASTKQDLVAINNAIEKLRL